MSSKIEQMIDQIEDFLLIPADTRLFPKQILS